VCADVEPEPYRTPAGSMVRCHLHTTGPELSGRTVQSLDASTGQASGASTATGMA
jgi:hypothetical protein